MTGQPAEAVRPHPAAIVSPLIDLLCVGGLSLLVLVPLLVSGSELDFVGIGALIWAQLLINMSHFMASYRIVYRDKQMILRHKWAAIWVPLILLGFAVLAFLEARELGARQLPILLTVFFVVSSAYLAWHYTGQVWGMMASFAYLEGVRFDDSERFLLRFSLRLLLAWHVAWFVNYWFSHAASHVPELVGVAYQALTAAAVLAFGLGAAGLLRMRLRIGRFPPLRAIIPWLAIFVWYAAMLRWGLKGLFLVQLAHALQYLEFPARVELNRAARKAAGHAMGHMVGYAVALLTVSFLVSLAVPGPPMSVLANFLGVDPGKAAPILLLYFINIHHYFTDGVVWKLSNPEVRRELFAHVPKPATGPAGGGGGAVAEPTGGKQRKPAKP